ncbi:MAG: LysM domain-containing protein [bacterium]|nr:LysM domain-containing protein [bacterium]
MNKSMFMFAGLALAAVSASAQSAPAARAAYQQQQALAEVPRLVQQFDLLVQNQDEIAARLVKLESADVTTDVRAEIAALKAEIADLRASIRREQDAMRAEIVRDLAGRMSKMMPPPAPAPAPVPVASSRPAARTAPPPPPPIGPHYEYIVEKGQTLQLIAKGFDTTVPKILAMNPGLKPNALRVGQKLLIPAEEQPKPAAPKKKGKR